MAVNDLPSNVSYGTVVGRFLLAYADGVDSNVYPDGVPATGTVLFTPSAAYIKDSAAVVGTTLTPVTILPATIECALDNEGYVLGSDGTRGVRLVATDDPDLNPNDWTWRVDYRLFDQDNAPVRTIPSHHIELPSNTIVDLTTAAPVAAGDGTFYIVGPRGLTGLRGRFFTGTTPPTFDSGEEDPLTTGDAWFDETTGRLYVYYDSFWVEASPNLAGPTGPAGPQGDAGADGQGVNLTVGTVTSVAAGTPLTVTITGSFPNQVINFELEQGEQGPQGIPGNDGAPGEPAMHPFMLAFS